MVKHDQFHHFYACLLKCLKARTCGVLVPIGLREFGGE